MQHSHSFSQLHKVATKSPNSCPPWKQLEGATHPNVDLFVVEHSLQLQEAPLQCPELHSQLLCLVLGVSLPFHKQVLVVHRQLWQGYHLLLYFNQHVLQQQKQRPKFIHFPALVTFSGKTTCGLLHPLPNQEKVRFSLLCLPVPFRAL